MKGMLWVKIAGHLFDPYKIVAVAPSPYPDRCRVYVGAHEVSVRCSVDGVMTALAEIAATRVDE